MILNWTDTLDVRCQDDRWQQLLLSESLQINQII